MRKTKSILEWKKKSFTIKYTKPKAELLWQTEVLSQKKKQTNIFMQCEKQPNRACFGCWMNVTHPQQTKNHTPILETTPLFIKAEIHQLKVDFLLLVLFVSLISNNRIQCETRTKQANKNTQTNSVRE